MINKTFSFLLALILVFSAMKITKIASILIGIVSIIIFILTEDMSLPMVYTDKWTILMCIFTIIEILNIVIMRRQSKENENETPE